MRSKQINLHQYNTDKISSGYLELYDPILESLVDQPITLLEIGIYQGESLKLWRDYFPKGTIVGVDIQIPKETKFGDRIIVFKGNQGDERFLTEISNRVAPQGYDIIIDDASHIAALTKKSFIHLFDHHLKDGGLYIIEDWGTGYWNDWPDGRSYTPRPYRISDFWSSLIVKNSFFARLPIKIPYRSHPYGMVGFVKELIDEQGMADISRKSIKGNPNRKSRFESLLITPSIVFVRKAKTQPGEGK